MDTPSGRLTMAGEEDGAWAAPAYQVAGIVEAW
jgi:hypothetical protein